ncbi:hypothetical protein C8J57DRAFT_1287801 [Mycena rebaudengoi]|nr:hypothetical protein C8J57DRAFT_1287801 [Mycena rebaudengoi]
MDWSDSESSSSPPPASDRGLEQTILVRGENGRIGLAVRNRFTPDFPPELTSQIFLHCLPDTEFIAPNPTSAPLLLGRVCRYWRTVSWATPRLWSSLRIDLEKFRQLNDPVRVYNLNLNLSCWISNARSAPFSIHLTDMDVWPVKRNDTVLSVLKALGALSAQWRNIYVDIYRKEFRTLLSTLAAEHGFPLLRKLVVTWQVDMRAHREGHKDALRLGDAPNLRELHLHQYPTSSVTSIPWERVTVFQTTRISMSDCLELFRCGARFVRYSCNVFPDPDSTGLVPCPLNDTLKTLSLIEIENFEDKNPPRLHPFRILHFLTLPALDELALAFRYRSLFTWDFSSLTSLASRSSFQLRKLTLNSIPTVADTLLGFIRSIPSLTVDMICSPGGSERVARLCSFQLDLYQTTVFDFDFFNRDPRSAQLRSETLLEFYIGEERPNIHWINY